MRPSGASRRATPHPSSTRLPRQHDPGEHAPVDHVGEGRDHRVERDGPGATSPRPHVASVKGCRGHEHEVARQRVTAADEQRERPARAPAPRATGRPASPATTDCSPSAPAPPAHPMLCRVPDRTERDLPFEDAWRVAGTVDGWLTEAQARDLYDAASAVAPGRVVEIGSHLGRSTIVLAATGAAVTAIDPFPDDWRYGRPDTEQRFRSHLASGRGRLARRRPGVDEPRRAGSTGPTGADGLRRRQARHVVVPRRPALEHASSSAATRCSSTTRSRRWA